MATSITKCVFSLSRCSDIISSITSRQIYLPYVCIGNKKLLSRCPIYCYGNRTSDNPQVGTMRTISHLRRRPGQDKAKDGHVNIPVDRLTVSYSRSSGPGGQHVNKVSTKAEVRFHVYTADWIPEDVRQNIILKNKNRVNKAGELLVTSEQSRSQTKNLQDCIQKISDIIAEASVKPHEPSAEDIALRASRLEKRNKERLKQKKLHSAIKQNRRVDFD